MKEKYIEALKILEFNSEEISMKDLKTRYKRLLKENHPDKNNGEEVKKIMKIKESYEILYSYMENYKIKFETEKLDEHAEYLRKKIFEDWIV